MFVRGGIPSNGGSDFVASKGQGVDAAICWSGVEFRYTVRFQDRRMPDGGPFSVTNTSKANGYCPSVG